MQNDVAFTAVGMVDYNLFGQYASTYYSSACTLAFI